IKELAGVGMGTKLPQAAAQTVAANGAAGPKILDVKPGPPPVLTKRGADILVQVEKMLDDAAKTADKTTSASEPSKPNKTTSSSALAFPENYAAAAASDAAAPRKN
ncbi:MAG: penicillin-binding protein, partial [Bradyrhizobium sp.]|nr:penicillin-binding protein [Bradyrhizobium sp.]